MAQNRKRSRDAKESAPAAKALSIEKPQTNVEPSKKRRQDRPRTLEEYNIDFVDHSSAIDSPISYRKLMENVLNNITARTPGLQMIVVCISAERALEILKDIRQLPSIRPAKLFARHIKIEEQIAQISTKTAIVGVGTPARILKLLFDERAQTGLEQLQHIVLDRSFKDKKNMTLVDSPDTGLSSILAMIPSSKWKLHAV